MIRVAPAVTWDVAVRAVMRPARWSFDIGRWPRRCPAARGLVLSDRDPRIGHCIGPGHHGGTAGTHSSLVGRPSGIASDTVTHPLRRRIDHTR